MRGQEPHLWAHSTIVKVSWQNNMQTHIDINIRNFRLWNFWWAFIKSPMATGTLNTMKGYKNGTCVHTRTFARWYFPQYFWRASFRLWIPMGSHFDSDAWSYCQGPGTLPYEMRRDAETAHFNKVTVSMINPDWFFCQAHWTNNNVKSDIKRILSFKFHQYPPPWQALATLLVDSLHNISVLQSLLASSCSFTYVTHRQTL